MCGRRLLLIRGGKLNIGTRKTAMRGTGQSNLHEDEHLKLATRTSLPMPVRRHADIHDEDDKDRHGGKFSAEIKDEE